MLIDPETCSWCFVEVEDSTLRELPDGARICRACVEQLRYEAKLRQLSLDAWIAKVTDTAVTP